MSWNKDCRAPKGQFRVIGVDAFEFPHVEYLVGDFADLDSALVVAKEEAQEMNAVAVYDENGVQVGFVSVENPV